MLHGPSVLHLINQHAALLGVVPRAVMHYRSYLLRSSQIKSLDVTLGRGKGRLLERLRKQRPEITRRATLQELPAITAEEEASYGVEYMASDILKPQPVKGW